MVTPHLRLLLRLKYPMKTPVVNNSGCIFCPPSSTFFENLIIVSNACLPPVVPGEQETPFLLLQLTSTVEYPTYPHSRRYTTICLVCQRNTMPRQVVSPLKYSLECHHHMRDAMIPGFLPEHVQAFNYNQRNLLPSHRHANGNCRECYC